MSNEKYRPITDDEVKKLVKHTDYLVRENARLEREVKAAYQVAGNAVQAQRDMEKENTSLKERFVSELDIIQSMLNQGRKNDAHTFINQKRKEYLSNDQPQKLKEGTGSENPTVQVHRDFQKRIGR